MAVKWKKIPNKDSIITGSFYLLKPGINSLSLWNNFNTLSCLTQGYTHYISVTEIINLPKE